MTKEVTTQIVTLDHKEYGITETKASEIQAVFVPMLNKMAELESEYNELIAQEVTEDLCKQAKTLRNKYVKIRTGTAAIHKELKDFYLKGGRFVDGFKNAQIMASEGIESKLKEIETTFERIEAERLEEIGLERIEAVSPYMDTELLDGSKLAEMDQDVFEAYLLTKKNTFEKAEAEAKAIIEAEEKARIEREAEEKRVREENEKLKKEAEEAEKVRLEKEESDRAEREARELKEAEEAKRQAEVQRLANEERDKANRKAEREALEKREAQEAKDLADKKAKEAIEEAERLKKEAEEAKELAKKIEAQRIANANTLAMESTEVTAELIEKAKAGGKCVFLKFVSVEMNTGKTGIYIQKSET